MHARGPARSESTSPPARSFSIEEADYYPWQYGLFRNDPYRVEDGHVTISDEPGWGVEIEPRWLEQSTYQVSDAP